VRKVIERQNGVRSEERLYLGGFEIYRKFGANALVRETLHVMDDKQRIALVETKTHESGSPVSNAQSAIRYQLGNHLGSASVELDKDGGLISYDEYYPYGTTAYQAMNSAAEVSLKRYRYSGKERDAETGLYYHGARYYAPWIARWTSSDPMAFGTQNTKSTSTNLSPNLYSSMGGNPVGRVDLDGKQDTGYTRQLDKSFATTEGAEKRIQASIAAYPLVSAGASFGPAAPVFGVIDTVKDISDANYKMAVLSAIAIIPGGKIFRWLKGAAKAEKTVVGTVKAVEKGEKLLAAGEKALKEGAKGTEKLAKEVAPVVAKEVAPVVAKEGAGKAAKAALGRSELLSIADKALAPLAKRFPDAKVGIRGSLARGTKGPQKGNLPFDPTNFDVDAFIVSDKLAGLVPANKQGFRNLARLAEFGGLVRSIGDQIKKLPGIRPDTFKVRVFSTKEFEAIVKVNERHFFK
jgi:RHS repeat-associated protein